MITDHLEIKVKDPVEAESMQLLGEKLIEAVLYREIVISHINYEMPLPSTIFGIHH